MARPLARMLLVVSACCASALGVEPPKFSPHPRFAFNPAEASNRLARAEALLKQPLVVPDQEAQWVFYYACPKDGTRLRPESLERHVCPTCKAVYTDERTVAAYRYLLNLQLNDQCLDLARAYALTQDERFAAPVRDALLKLARIYPTLERHDRWGRRGLLAVVGGRRYAQLLDEATGIIPLARAYDLTCTAKSYTVEDRATIEQGILGATVRELQQFQMFIGAESNHQTWFNAAYAAVGLAIGDADLLEAAAHGPRGLLWQLEHSVTRDGLWYEGTFSYHFYALSAICQTLDILNQAGWNFSGNERLKNLWRGPAMMTYPDGRLPALNDGDPINLRAYTGFYDWAHDYFHEPGQKGEIPPPPTGSMALEGTGLAILRLGSGREALCAMIDYGPHGGGHGHFDKLNLVLYANNREWLLDPGRLTYSVPEYTSWAKTTAAHNTVTVNGANQRAAAGKLLWLRHGDGWAACGTETAEAYPDTTLRRYVWLAAGVLVDIYEVKTKSDSQIDLLMHVQSKTLEPVEPLTRTTESPGSRDGYQHLEDGQHYRVKGGTRWTFDKTLSVWLAGPETEDIFTANGIGYSLTQRVPCLIRRQHGREVRFVTVYDLSGPGEFVREVKPTGEIVTTDGRWIVRVDSDGKLVVER